MTVAVKITPRLMADPADGLNPAHQTERQDTIGSVLRGALEELKTQLPESGELATLNRTKTSVSMRRNRDPWVDS